MRNSFQTFPYISIQFLFQMIQSSIHRLFNISRLNTQIYFLTLHATEEFLDHLQSKNISNAPFHLWNHSITGIIDLDVPFHHLTDSIVQNVCLCEWNSKGENYRYQYSLMVHLPVYSKLHSRKLNVFSNWMWISFSFYISGCLRSHRASVSNRTGSPKMCKPPLSHLGFGALFQRDVRSCLRLH